MSELGIATYNPIFGMVLNSCSKRALHVVIVFMHYAQKLLNIVISVQRVCSKHVNSAIVFIHYAKKLLNIVVISVQRLCSKHVNTAIVFTH